MNWSRFYVSVALIFVLAISCIPFAGTMTNSETHSDLVIDPIVQLAPSETFSLESLWDDIYSKVSESNALSIVRTLSQNYGQRVWFPLDKNGSLELLGAWEWVNDTIKTATGNELEFHFLTEYLNLVAIKEGTEDNLAPILIVGTIASRYTTGPGANTYGSSVAAVIEAARILNQYDLTNDIYFVLTNTISAGNFNFENGNQGLQNLIGDLENQGRKPAGIIWFNQLLYSDPVTTYGENIRLDWNILATPYDPVAYIIRMARTISEISGTNILTVANQSSSLPFWYSTGGYEGWRNGIPSISLGQFYGDPYSYNYADEWDVWAYDYAKIAEAVGLASSIVATLGRLGYGEAPELTRSIGVGAYSQASVPLPITGLSIVNVSLSWNKNFSVRAEIRTPTGATILSRNESDQAINMSCLNPTRGEYSIRFTNYGNESISILYNYAQFQDLDWDNLDDYEEYLFGTDSLSTDTDSDLLSDPDEQVFGTNPRLADSDADGAIDGIEIIYGSNPLVQDSDGDTLLDGYEIDHGYDPSSNDTDGEGLTDDFELDFGTDPRLDDTDRDGIDDYQEWLIGTNALSPDSDQDGLSDLFEVLNALNPLSADTDLDGLSDAYEVEHCLMPFDADTDRDGIPDGQDWAPREHWIMLIPPVILIAFTLAILGILFSKRRAYIKGGEKVVIPSYAKNNAFNGLRSHAKGMKGTGFKLGLSLIVLSLFIGSSVTMTGTIASHSIGTSIESPVLSATTYFNATDLFLTIWEETSIDNIGNYTKYLSETYPNRIWNTDDGANQNLTDAWEWANEVLQNNTNDELTFAQETDFEHLIAIKQGTAPAPRPALVITGIIDSEYTPGANDAAVTVAVVLEVARILHDYDLAYDVYYVLLNGVHLDEDYDLGGGAFVDWIVAQGVQSFTTISYDRLMFQRTGYLYGYKVNIRTYSSTSNYHDAGWIPDMMIQISSQYGNGFFQQVSDLSIAQRSCAYEFWQAGRPALYVTQGYLPDPQSNTEDDTWDNPDFSLVKAAEVASTTASIVSYMGLLGSGEVPQRYLNGWLNITSQEEMRLTASLKGFLNGTVTWDNATTLQVSIVNSETGEVVYQRTESDGTAVLKYLVQDFGAYHFNVTNIGGGATNFTLTVTLHEDMDGDTINDYDEVALGTSPYLRDSDLDGLSDDFEINAGTNPTSDDTDGDGASDYDEYTWGSSLLSNDTDGDLISDGTEAQLGTNPTSADTDGDGLNDYQEVYVIFSNPLSADTDLDGLEDGFEYEMGLNLLSPDTDGDSLSDLFEVLNNLSPFTADTDGDGWSDAYEVEYCMLPNSDDTDGDGIPDGIDWDPQEHWITVVSPVALLSVILLMIIYSFLKMRVYKRE
ncbi:MAG: M28 family peptidase [Candidatus Thorarchaeota archaeon]